MNTTTTTTAITTTSTTITIAFPFSSSSSSSSFSFSKTPLKRHCFNHFLKLNKQHNAIRHSLMSLNCICQTPNPSLIVRSSAAAATAITTATQLDIETEVTVRDKLQRLVFEFRSLTEPIDRVKRLLHYAAVLPPFPELARTESNRVKGCTTQVWLEAALDEFGKMRFRADSDSEITKGFVSCLVWLLDKADPREVLTVEAEDLAEMNVGVHGKEKSRVNTWHNVLFAMQERTKSFVEEREKLTALNSSFSASLVVGVDGGGGGSGGGGGDTIRVLDLSARL